MVHQKFWKIFHGPSIYVLNISWPLQKPFDPLSYILNVRSLIRKFCDKSKKLLSSSWAIFIRAFVHLLSTRVKFYSLEYLCFSFLLIFLFLFNYYARVKTEKLLYYQKDWEVSIMISDLNNSQSQLFLI